MFGVTCGSCCGLFPFMWWGGGDDGNIESIQTPTSKPLIINSTSIVVDQSHGIPEPPLSSRLCSIEQNTCIITVIFNLIRLHQIKVYSISALIVL